MGIKVGTCQAEQRLRQLLPDYQETFWCKQSFLSLVQEYLNENVSSELDVHTLQSAFVIESRPSCEVGNFTFRYKKLTIVSGMKLRDVALDFFKGQIEKKRFLSCWQEYERSLKSDRELMNYLANRRQSGV